MPVFRVEKNNNYTIMSNYHFLDISLSWKAKGILSNMLSLPEDWDYSLAGLVQLSCDGINATRTALKELEEKGYLVRRQIKDNGKIIDWEYIIYEYPQNRLQIPLDDFPQVEIPLVVFPQVENRTQLNTKELNTKELNTKELKYIVDFLNEKAGTAYKSSSQKTRKLINARFNEGFNLDDFKVVIETKCEEWENTNFEKFLRPETLFGTHFEGYLNSAKKNNVKPGKNEKLGGMYL